MLAGLWRAARAGRLAHALCFAGPDGVGKHLAAEWLTLGLFCARGPVVVGEPRPRHRAEEADRLVLGAVPLCPERDERFPRDEG